MSESIFFLFYKNLHAFSYPELRLLKEGLIAVYSVPEDGDHTLTQILPKGSLINILPSGVAYDSYRAITDCTVQLIPIERIRKDDPEIVHALFEVSQAANRALITRIRNLSGKPVRDKLRWAVLTLERLGYRIPANGRVPKGTLPLLGAMTGTDPCTISRTLKELRVVSYDIQAGGHRHD